MGDRRSRAGPGRPAPPRPAQPGAESATRLLRELAEGREVVLTLEPARTRGGFGRLLAFVALPDGTLANRRLLEAGLARADDRWGHSRLDDFARAQTRARDRAVGLWSDQAEILP